MISSFTCLVLYMCDSFILEKKKSYHLLCAGSVQTWSIKKQPIVRISLCTHKIHHTPIFPLRNGLSGNKKKRCRWVLKEKPQVCVLHWRLPSVSVCFLCSVYWVGWAVMFTPHFVKCTPYFFNFDENVFC